MDKPTTKYRDNGNFYGQFTKLEISINSSTTGRLGKVVFKLHLLKFLARLISETIYIRATKAPKFKKNGHADDSDI